jgi:restriction system protein
MSIQTNIMGREGEQKTRNTLKLFLENAKYHIINNLLIESGHIPTQIDHVVISKFGIFVVETKSTNSWIYGSRNDKRWTKAFYKKKYRVPNPLHQNFGHTQALAEFLKINNDQIFSLVVFWGDFQFRKDMPPNVVEGTRIIDYIKSKRQILLNDDEVDRIFNELKKIKGNTPILSGLHHINKLKKRYESNTICPKCDGLLKERIARKGKRTGEKFLGCENYPRCKYTKEP